MLDAAPAVSRERRAIAVAAAKAMNYTSAIEGWAYLGSQAHESGERLGAAALAEGLHQEPWRLAKWFGVHLHITDAGAAEGSVQAGPKGLTVQVRGDPLEPRARATLAHELGHTLFWSLPERGVPRPIAVPAFPNRDTRAQEDAVWSFARAFLLPSPQIRQHLMAAGFPAAEAIDRVASLFRVSWPLLAVRVTRDLPEGLSLVVVYIWRSSDGSVSTRIFEGPEAGAFVNEHGLRSLLSPSSSDPAHRSVTKLLTKMLRLAPAVSVLTRGGDTGTAEMLVFQTRS